MQDPLNEAVALPGGVADASDFVGLVPDERLFEEQANLPESERFIEARPESRTRGAIVAAGATLTGLSLIGGAALAVLGIVLALVNGISGLNLALIAVGVMLVATHWGWVHLAEVTANAIAERGSASWRARRDAWLSSLEPYTRWSVTTNVLDDGSIRIERWRHRPVKAAQGTFTFVREQQASETHGPDELSAVVVERAETMRHEAALETSRQQELWQVAADAYTAALSRHAGEAERRQAQIAAAKALSDRINTKLGEPPLIE